MVAEKRCASCAETKPIDAFGIDRVRKDGRNPYCRACRSSAYKANPDGQIARSRAWYAANRGHAAVRQAEYDRRNAAAKRARDKAYRQANLDKIKARLAQTRDRRVVVMAEYRQRNRDRRRRQRREWGKRHPEKSGQYRHERAARLAAAPGTHSEADWQRILNRHGGQCAYCHAAPATVREHVVPLSRGGSNYIGNILPACLPCNSSKRDRLLIEWRAYLAVRAVA